MADYLTAAEAARRLGVKPATLYAYVSRGVLTRSPAADGRASLFSTDEGERAAPPARARPRRPRGARPPVRLPPERGGGPAPPGPPAPPGRGGGHHGRVGHH